uniref:Uncharacterized protein n=1 Tax=Setaria italica TaxID=4555 RepID=K3YNU7_SETIT
MALQRLLELLLHCIPLMRAAKATLAARGAHRVLNVVVTLLQAHHPLSHW